MKEAKMSLVERLLTAPVYEAGELGLPARRVDEQPGSGRLDIEVILIGLDTRDEIVRLLSINTPSDREKS